METTENNTTPTVGSITSKAADGCRWITVNQLERKLQISRATIYRWMQKQIINGYRFEKSRYLYFNEAEIDEFLKLNLITPKGRIDKVGLSVELELHGKC